MNNITDTHTTNRRTFLRQAACAALGATAMVNTLSYLQLTSAALASGTQDDDYRALVCIFLAGGNDSNNLLIPGGNAAGNTMRADYEQGRGELAITGLNNSGLNNSLMIPSDTGAFVKHYGTSQWPMVTHPNAGEIAELFNAGDLSFVCNVGTLAEPISTSDEYRKGTVALPKDLFSHSDQQMAWQTSVADSISSSGWGGRVAEMIHAGKNGAESQVSMSISIAGVNTFLRSDNVATAPFSVGPEGVQALRGFGDRQDPYKNAYVGDSGYNDPVYQESRMGARLQTVEKLVRLSRENLFAQSYANTVDSARELSETVGSALFTVDELGIDAHFTNAETKLGDQLKMVAKLIAGRSTLGNKRQIFFVSVGGYDIHREHLASHAELMEELSTGLMAFSKSLKALNVWDKVVSFTASDFNRTLTANGTDESAGTDHAWGGHAMVMGGPVSGGNLFGHFPSLKTGDGSESIDVEQGRGRWIPAVSVDQYSAVLAKWLGVDSNSMDEIFPNLSRFDDPFTSTTPNLDFLSA